MSDVTRLLSAIDQGDSQAAERLLPLVYDELRRLAAQRLRHERPGQTLQATDLVHEAYVRLVGDAHGAMLGSDPAVGVVLTIPPREAVVRLKLLIAASE